MKGYQDYMATQEYIDGYAAFQNPEFAKQANCQPEKCYLFRGGWRKAATNEASTALECQVEYAQMGLREIGKDMAWAEKIAKEKGWS